MIGRPKERHADHKAIRLLDKVSIGLFRPLFAYIMYHSGISYTEIGECFETSRQNAEYMVKRVSNSIGK